MNGRGRLRAWPLVALFIGAAAAGAVIAGHALRASPTHQTSWVAVDVAPAVPAVASVAHMINERGEFVVAAGCGVSGHGCRTGTPPAREFLRSKGKFLQIGHGALNVAGLNSRGEVVGAVADKIGGEQHAFIWENGRMEDLGAPARTIGSASAINTRSQVAGTREDANGTARGFVWQADRMREIPPLAGRSSSSVSQLDDSGTALGESWSDDPSRADSRKDDAVFLWRKGRSVSLGRRGGPLLLRAGRLVAHDSSGYCSEPSLWQNGGWTQIDSQHWEASCALALNDRGVVAGLEGTPPSRGFVWHDGIINRFRLPSQGSDASILLNNRGLLAVTIRYRSASRAAEPEPARAYVRRNGRWSPLPSLGGRWNSALAINDAGAIVGWSSSKSGRRHAVLWTPPGSAPPRNVRR
jgi:probable HAF family extracellular repeat protein